MQHDFHKIFFHFCLIIKAIFGWLFYFKLKNVLQIHYLVYICSIKKGKS